MQELPMVDPQQALDYMKNKLLTAVAAIFAWWASSSLSSSIFWNITAPEIDWTL